MAKFQYDLTIIGGGSGGLTAARIAASLGAHVLLIDKKELGGDCLYYGCVPSKSLIHVARVVKEAQEALQIGLTLPSPGVDMAKVSQYIQGVIQRVHDTEQVYTEHVTVKLGNVSFHSPTELLLNDETVTSRNTIIATGSRPSIPNIEGLAESGYFTNEDLFDLNHLPRSMIVVGGGPIGVEMSQAFARLGTQVTLLGRANRLLPKEDPDASSLLAQVFESEGIQLALDTTLLRVERKGNKKVVYAKRGEQVVTFEADALLIALGRTPNIENLGLENAGVTTNERGIIVDDYLQTAASNILAIGDVIGGYLFTHVASYQAGIAARNALVPVGKKKVDYRVVPWCTFTDPEVARVGFTLDEAKEQHKDAHEEVFPYANIDRAQAENATTGFIKLVLAGKKDEIVGVHIVGKNAGELLGEATLAMQHHMTISDIYNTIHAYPTLSTGLQQAAFEAYLRGNGATSNRRVVRTILNFRS